MNTIATIREDMGVDTTSPVALDPRQQKFISYYLSSDSNTFANCYQSAIKAGFTNMTARNLTHNKPKWLSETVGQNQDIEPEHILIKLRDIMNAPEETTLNKLKAIDMLMKYKGMYQNTQHNILEFRKISIESVLD
jgi:hypothetical protein